MWQLTCDKCWILWHTDLWTISLFNYTLGGRITYWAISMRFVFLVFYFFFLSRKSALPQGGLVWGMNAEVVCADKLTYAFWKPGAWEGKEIRGLQALQTRMCSLWCLRQVAVWQDFCGEALWYLSNSLEPWPTIPSFSPHSQAWNGSCHKPPLQGHAADSSRRLGLRIKVDLSSFLTHYVTSWTFTHSQRGESPHHPTTNNIFLPAKRTRFPSLW